MKNKNLFLAILTIAFGIVLCVFRSEVMEWIAYVVAGLLILLGIMGVAAFFSAKKKKDVVSLLFSLIEIAGGVLIIIFAQEILEYALIILGAYFIFVGAYALLPLLGGKKVPQLKIIMALLSVVLGILLIVVPFAVSDVFFIVVGALAVIDGVFTLVKAK
ncbi:MAG TPA: DUF308 domain-containing protein [Candidatus Faecicola pullistercoris]|nr:DUF308 domain-containing protein [Candidatus Faecicola pullistercoris]